jgi:Flp pilus assembly CpaE family ATPase
MVDVPEGSGAEHQHVLKTAAVRILVLDPTLASMRHTIRLLKSLGQEEIGRQTILVLNRRWPQSDGDLSIEEIEKALNHRIDVTIPFGKNLFVTAENAGELVTAKPSPITEAFTELVQELSGRPRTKTTLLQRLMKKATSPFQNAQANLITFGDRGHEPEIVVHGISGGPDEGNVAVPNGAEAQSFKSGFGNSQQPPKQ